MERLAHARRVLLQRLATQHHLSPLQAEILLRLVGETGDARVGALANELGVAGSTITDAVRALLRKGHLVNEPDPADGRRKVIRLTRSGRDLGATLAVENLRLEAPMGAIATDRKAVMLQALLDVIAGLHRADIITIDRSCKTCRHFDDRATPGSAQCTLLNMPLRPSDLRVRCEEHVPAGGAVSRGFA